LSRADRAREHAPTFDPDKLMALAKRARDRAYAPYSGLKVGAAVLSGGRVFRGANIENAAYPVTICAERVAAAQAVHAGAGTLWAVAVASSAPRAAPPCGMCRQFLFEFNPAMVVLAEGENVERLSWTLSELLPDGFGSKHLPWRG
jgi:cytidine deaminase